MCNLSHARTRSRVVGTLSAILAWPSIVHCWKGMGCFLRNLVKMPATACPHCAAILPLPCAGGRAYHGWSHRASHAAHPGTSYGKVTQMWARGDGTRRCCFDFTKASRSLRCRTDECWGFASPGPRSTLACTALGSTRDRSKLGFGPMAIEVSTRTILSSSLTQSTILSSSSGSGTDSARRWGAASAGAASAGAASSSPPPPKTLFSCSQGASRSCVKLRGKQSGVGQREL